MKPFERHPPGAADPPYAWFRLGLSLLTATIGGVGLWSVVVILPLVEAEFGVARADASLPYTLLMVGFAVGGVMMGKLADRHGVSIPLFCGSVALAVGYAVASQAQTLWQFALAHGLLIGLLGSSATFGPIIADISRWFTRNRGIAVAVAACGSYLAGTIWPPVVQQLADWAGWRQTYFGIGLFCLVTIMPLAVVLRRPAPATPLQAPTARSLEASPLRGMTPNTLQGLLVIAGITCCIAMAMPQVHIVALCADLGFGTARGAQMLSLMLATGILSRLAFGWMADRLGPLPTLLLSSGLQAISLLLFLPFEGLAPLFLVSALFGLAQGGIVPTYAMIVREFLPPAEAGARIGLVLSATLLGMATGGWMSGAIFDLTLSYELAFLNGFLWNLVNLGIALWLLLRLSRRRVAAAASPEQSAMS